MTITQIKYFITVAKCCSFTRAAEQLFVTQPALSRHIRVIEEELNLQLFIRTNTSIRLTPAGEELFEGLSKIYDSYTHLVEKAEKIQAGLTGSLNIGVLAQTNIGDFMPLIYQDFQKNYPNIDLHMEAGSFSYLIDRLYSGELDMIFTLQFEIIKKDSLMYQYVVHSKDHLVMSKHHPLANNRSLSLEDVKEELFIMISPDDNPESAELIFNICKKHGFIPNARYARTLEEQILWVESGMGITILDSRCELKNNPYIKFFEIDSDWDPSLVICWHQENSNPLIPIFLKELRDFMPKE